MRKRMAASLLRLAKGKLVSEGQASGVTATTKTRWRDLGFRESYSSCKVPSSSFTGSSARSGAALRQKSESE